MSKASTLPIDFDIHEQVGPDAGMVVTVPVTVAAEPLDIVFVDEPENNPKISAIEVRTAGPPPTDVPPLIIGDRQHVDVGGRIAHRAGHDDRARR